MVTTETLASKPQIPEYAIRRMAGFFLSKMQAELEPKKPSDESRQG